MLNGGRSRIYFSVAHGGVQIHLSNAVFLAVKTADLPVQKFSKKVKKKLASFREVQ
jgi:hypothetical protein